MNKGRVKRRRAIPSSSKTAEVVIDLSHGQENWGWGKFSKSFTSSRIDGQVAFITGNLLKEREILDRASAPVLALPYFELFLPDEAKRVRGWVEDGGGLFLMGYYAADTHHGSNPSRIARDFGCEFADNLVMPAGGSDIHCRAQYNSYDERFVTRLDLTSEFGHPIVKEIRDVSIFSSCSITTTWGSTPSLLLRSYASEVWIPEGPRDGDGWSRPKITRWTLARTEAAPLFAAFEHGEGRVILSGTWKLGMVDHGDNTKLLNQALAWLSRKGEPNA